MTKISSNVVKLIFCNVVGLLPWPAYAVTFKVGAVTISENGTDLRLLHNGSVIATADARTLNTIPDETEFIQPHYLRVGKQIIDLKSGKRARPDPARNACRTSHSAQKTALYNRGQILTLTPQDQGTSHTVAYVSALKESRYCRIIAREIIQDDLLDLFFEFGGGRFGWWLVGSEERSVLIRPRKGEWKKLPVPGDISNVLTALWKDDGSIWLIANQVIGAEVSPIILRTDSLGKSWEKLGSSQQNVPPYWFAARRELAKNAQTAESPSVGKQPP